MNNIQFCKSFYFKTCNFKKYHHTDNSSGTACHHMGYIKSGSAVFDVEGEIFEFCEGDVFYTPEGCKYHSYWRGDVICYDSYAFTVFPDSGKKYGIQKLHMTEKATEYLSVLTENKTVNCKSVGLLYGILGEVLPNMTPIADSKSNETVAKAKEYMREHIDCSVPQLCHYLGLSESSLYKLFREKEHSTPIAEKNRIRTELAKDLLATTDMSVEEISDTLGFSSTAYFRKVLHEFSGKTPRQIRKELNIV